MQKLVANMKWVMLGAGALTCTMLFAAVAPQAARLFISSGASRIRASPRDVQALKAR